MMISFMVEKDTFKTVYRYLTTDSLVYKLYSKNY